MDLLCEIVFCLSAAVVVYTFAGYYLLSVLLAALRPRRIQRSKGSSDLPSLSVVLVVRSEAARIRERIENLLACDYPEGKKEIVVVSVGSTDETVPVVKGEGFPGLVFIEIPADRGKSCGLNEGVASAKGEIVVFADARQEFHEDALIRLAGNFGDLSVGAVSGSLEVEGGRSGPGRGVDLYWRMEKDLRRAEAARDSSIGCTGAIYAIRKSLYVEIPEDTILDDVVIPMSIAEKGARIAFEERAKAFDPQRLEGKRETRRKIRTLAGNYQMLFRYPSWLVPWRNRLWWRLISHKYLRLLAPFALLALVLSNAALLGRPFFTWVLGGQLLFYGLALLGFVPGEGKKKMGMAAASGFLFLNALAVASLFHYFKNRRSLRW